MRLWLSKGSEIPLRDQLATQMLLGVVSGDLKPGQRLPSTRELAQRYHIHANTVSAAYRDLARRGWVEFRKGSGVYVRDRVVEEPVDQQAELDRLIDSLLRVARDRGYSLREIQLRIKHWLDSQPADHFLVVEPDKELREILIAEISEAVGFPTRGADLDGLTDATTTGAAPLAMYGMIEQVRSRLPASASLTALRIRSVSASITGQQRPAPDDLIAVVSRWPDFCKWARTVLEAASIDPDSLSFRDARRPGWRKGLTSSSLVISDTLTARSLPAGCKARVFRIIADSCLDELKRLKTFFAGQSV